MLMHPPLQYLLGYLEGISDAPRLTDPDFQQLLVNVQAGKVSAWRGRNKYPLACS